ncbi:sugar nucleotide-binding protein [Selenomonas ruminantium]|uniref:SDR family oxidoreductase n=1 Tax=Selenomonas ruminantium TaxID=971 RepID=UPI0026EF65E7|nr:sugar nucleotide-binding protein [Selenomonas ruminantium]
MRLLVIGASGLVGRTVYRLAKERGWGVIGTSTHGTADLETFNLMSDQPERLGEFIPLNNDTVAVIAAAKTNIAWCSAHLAEAHAINVDSMKRLLIYLTARDVKTLYYSSDAVFNGKIGNYTEVSPKAPLNVYGKQKAEMEDWLHANLPSVLVYRLAKLVDISHHGRHLFSDLYQQYQAGHEIRCIAGLTFNPTYVDDVAVCSLIGLEQRLCGLYNVANSEVFTREQIAKLFFQWKNCRIRSIPLADWHFREPKALNTTLNADKFRQKINYTFNSMQTLTKKFWSELD